MRNSKTRLEHRGAQAEEEEARGENQRMLCYNLGLFSRRYRLGVRTEDSQSSNPGSIPGSATKYPPATSLAGLDPIIRLVDDFLGTV